MTEVVLLYSSLVVGFSNHRETYCRDESKKARYNELCPPLR